MMLNRRTSRLIAIAACAAAVAACGDEDVAPLFVCEDSAISKVLPDECQSDEDCPGGMICVLDLVSEDLICRLPEDHSLQWFPGVPTVGWSANACVPPTSVLLINQSNETIRVDALQTRNFVLISDSPREGTGEVIATAELPQELAPLDSLAIDLQFFSETPGVGGIVDLEVLTSKGCERFAVRGIRDFNDSTMSSPRAVDLGTASPGTRGEPVDIVFTGFDVDPDTIFSAGGVSDGIFEVVDPIASTQVRSCEPMRTSVRFDAPLEPGVYEGLFSWTTEGDTLAGLAFIHLRARVE